MRAHPPKMDPAEPEEPPKIDVPPKSEPPVALRVAASKDVGGPAAQ